MLPAKVATHLLSKDNPDKFVFFFCNVSGCKSLRVVISGCVAAAIPARTKPGESVPHLKI